MHSALVQELADVRRRDTEICVPAVRTHRIRATTPVEARIVESHEIGECAGPWIDPGDTMAKASPIELILREAIVRRNHRVERSADPVPAGCAAIDWARSMDRGLSVKRVGRGVLRIEGRPASLARVSIGIDGLAFTVAIPPGAAAAEAIAARLATHYRIEIVEESPDSRLLVLAAPRSHT